MSPAVAGRRLSAKPGSIRTYVDRPSSRAFPGRASQPDPCRSRSNRSALCRSWFGREATTLHRAAVGAGRSVLRARSRGRAGSPRLADGAPGCLAGEAWPGLGLDGRRPARANGRLAKGGRPGGERPPKSQREGADGEKSPKSEGGDGQASPSARSCERRPGASLPSWKGAAAKPSEFGEFLPLGRPLSVEPPLTRTGVCRISS